MKLGGPVVHVIAPSPAGGAESVVLALASAAKNEARVAVLNQVGDASTPPLPLTRQLRERDVAVEEIRCGRRRYGAEITALEQHLRATSAALVHTHGYHGTVVGHYAARRLGLPMVATVHGYLSRTFRERLYDILDRRLLRSFHGVIAVSQDIRDQLVRSGVPSERIHVVQNGIPEARSTDRVTARAELALGVADLVVGWIGRLSAEKGPDLFLQALAQGPPSAIGVMIGDGPEAQRLTEQARQLGLGDRIRFAGYRPNAADSLRAFDALALSSRTEGTPMVILEAVAAGVPIVAFNVGGIPNLLDDDSAWLVPQGDVAGLAGALGTALSSAEDRHRRAAIARERLGERLSLARWSERVASVYRAADELSRTR